MQTWCQQRTKSLKRSPPQLLLLYLASKHLAEWQKKVSLLCLNTVAGYSEEAPSILGVYHHSYVYHYLLALVELISRWIQNFRRTAGLYLPCFSWLKHWTKRFCADFSRSVAKRMQVITNKTHHNTLINGMSLFFPENSTDFVFQKISEKIQSKIVYFYSVIDEYSPRSRGVYSTPSWHKWSDFEYRPWCLAIVVRTPPGLSVWNRRLKSHLLIKNVEPSRA